jgi:hypothetical protein
LTRRNTKNSAEARGGSRVSLPFLLAAFTLLTAFGARLNAQDTDSPSDSRKMVVECGLVRDRVLLSSPPGHAAVNYYYTYSPFAEAAIQPAELRRTRVAASIGIQFIAVFLKNKFFAAAYVAIIGFTIIASIGKLASLSRRTVAVVWLVFIIAGAVVWGIPASGMFKGESRKTVETIRSATPTLAESGAYLAHPDPQVRYEALFAMECSRNRQFEDVFIKAMDDPDVRVRRWAAHGLGEFRSARGFDRLVKALDDPEIMVRYKAARALGMIRDKRAVPILRRKLDAGDVMFVKSWILDALDKLYR